MGHVLNCIEGKGGRNFNAKWGHVCEGLSRDLTPAVKDVAEGVEALLELVEDSLP